MTDNRMRPNPDELLKHVQDAETRQGRGRLKVFLGYAAGVGKTYAMLEAARQRKAEGADIVVGYVETHGRPETERLLEGVEIIPRKRVEYRGITLEEMDLDAVLTRRPQIAVVDELAHTNAPGSRHAKRYQDVLELLNAGIDVYTTLNIQHVDSLNDIVAQITDVVVRETVPDRMLDEADDIELIDLPPEELRQRLEEGKVYVPEQAEQAIRKFFRPGNLTALRELALRRTAERVDEQLRAYMQTHAIPGPWPAGDRLLVCISSSPLSERLVRASRRLAARLDAEWFAVYIETPDQASLSEAERDRMMRVLRLAEDLGARVVTLSGHSVAESVVNYAKTHNVTKIVAGKPLRSRWEELFHGSVIDQIIRLSGDLDVYVISSEPEPAEGAVVSPDRQKPRQYRQYANSLALVIAATLFGLPLRPLVEPTNLVMLYLLAVVIAASRWGRRLAVLTSVLSVAAFDFVFVPPYYTYAVADAQYLLTFAGLLVVGIVISTLAAQAREQAKLAQRREAQTMTLYEFNRDLAISAERDHVAQAVATHVEQTFGAGAFLLLPSDGRLESYPAGGGLVLDEHEQAVATWVYEHGQPAGRGTDTLAGARGYYLPLKTTREVLGVLGVYFNDAAPKGYPLTPEQRRLLESFAGQAALAIDRIELAEKARQAQLLRETEKLQTALLNSISHDLRTPLASITGALSSLRTESDMLGETARRDLLDTAWEEAERLNTLVGNLLDMTRLESGALKVAEEPCDVQDVIGVALSRLGRKLRDRPISVEVPHDLPFVPLDFVLIVQVLVNVLDNAIKYSPSDAPIEIEVRLVDSLKATCSEVVVEIRDRGVGIPEADLGRVFDKFYRVQRAGRIRADGAGGTGLGLSISKGMVEAHGGRIWAQNRPGGGTAISIALPLERREATLAKAGT